MFENHTKRCRSFSWYLLLLAGILSATVAGVTEEKVKVRQIVGTVEIRMSGSGAWRPARLAMVLRTGWDIRTFVESSAELEYESGTIIRLGENSVVTLTALVTDPAAKSANTGIKVPAGQIWANVKKLTSVQSSFDFETPTAVASIRGTRLGINVVKGKTSVDVYEGTVAVRNKGSGKETNVNSREQAVIAQGQAGIVVSDMGNRKGGQGGAAVVDPFTGDTLKTPADSGKKTSADSLKKADSLKHADSTKPANKKPDSGSVGGVPDSSKQTKTTSRYDSTLAPLTIDLTTPLPQSIVTQTPVFVRGKTLAGVQVTLAGKTVQVGGDGSFSDFIDLRPGSNSIAVTAKRGSESKTAALNLVYRPPLFLNVTNIIDNMEVVSSDLDLDIEVSDGAQYSINGINNISKVTLLKGKNQIVVTAWDRWNNRTEKTFFVTYKTAAGFVLSVASPQDNATITVPMIPVSGSTSPGAQVMVNGTQVSVNSSGFFTTQIPIPDEERDYTIEITARLSTDEKTEQRTVTYAPPVKPLDLAISSPCDEQNIKTSSIHITGKTSDGATVKVNGRPAIVSAKGLISMDLQLSEKDIGTYMLEAIASRDDQEITKTVSVKVDMTSPQINTSIPRIQVTGLGRQATRTSQITLQAFDQTPNDQLSVTVNDNGSTDNYTLDPGGRETYMLNEGKNKLVFRAQDLAGNQAPPVQSEIYYLPGPLEISVIEPADNTIDVEDLPPWPRGAATLSKIHFRVEIKDNIGTVPETIQYCRVTSSTGQTVVLNNERDYFYYGDMPVARGNTAFTIQVEDLAGTIQMKKIDMRVKE